MSETLSIVVAIFGLVGLGYAAARSGLLAGSVREGLTEFALKVAIPLLLFDTLATADLQGLSPWRLWAAYFVPFAIVWALSHLMIRRVFGREARAGVVAGGSAAFSNSVLIGIPLVQAAFGDAGIVYLIVIVAIHLPVMMLVSVLLNEWALERRRHRERDVPHGCDAPAREGACHPSDPARHRRRTSVAARRLGPADARSASSSSSSAAPAGRSLCSPPAWRW